MPPDALVAALRGAGCVFAEDEARLLREAAADEVDLARMLAERLAGVPLEQVVGYAEFCGLRVAVAPGVFVPRLRSSALVRLGARFLAPGDLALDLCCGTGAIAAALLAAVPGLEVYAADLDPDAVACARRNLPVERVLEGDLYDAVPAALRGRLAVVVANAPYVPTDAIATMPPEARDHEHRVALDGGADGLDVQRGVVAGAPDWLAPGGRVLVETSRGQAPATARLMTDAGLAVEVVTDADVDGTVAVGRTVGAVDHAPDGGLPP
jgi:release factor glutamine methyltransferase